MTDPVQGFLFTISGALVFVKAFAEVAFYVLGALAFRRYLKNGSK